MGNGAAVSKRGGGKWNCTRDEDSSLLSYPTTGGVFGFQCPLSMFGERLMPVSILSDPLSKAGSSLG